MITPRTPVGSEDIAGHYDELDGYYRRLWGVHVHHGLWLTGRESPQQAVRQLMSHVADRLRVDRGGRVCDVGCGYGGTSRYLAAEHGAEVTGLTISRAQHQYALQQSAGAAAERPGESPPPPRFLLRDWQQNGLQPASFDGLVSIECLAHVPDKPLFFREVRRVLRPGGRAVVTAWLAGDDPSPRQQERLLEPICREGRLPGMGSQAEYAALIEQAGLRLDSFEDLSQQVMRTWRVCVRRVAWTLMISPSAWAFVLRRRNRHRVFLPTVWRIDRAYRCGAMRYGLFVMTSPS